MRFREKLGGEFDTGGISENEAQNIFIAAIEKEAPEVLQGLLQVENENGLQTWAEKHNLKDTWFIKVAKQTLDMWRQFPELAEGELEFIRPAVGYFRPITRQQHQFNFNHFGWSVESESRSRFKKRIMAEFENCLEKYLDEIEEMANEMGLSKTPEIRTLDHFGWLVMAKVKRMKHRDIADIISDSEPEILTEDMIGKGIRKAASMANVSYK